MTGNILAAALLLTVAQSQCSKKQADTLPACIQARIDEIKKEPRWNPPATVTEYRYDGRRVFLFSANCCDQFNTVVDADCNYVCAPSGGITGKGDRKCPDFSQQAQLQKVVWKDDRK